MTTAVDSAEQSAADDSIIDTIVETASVRQPTGEDGYRTDSGTPQMQTAKPIINVQGRANDFLDQGRTGAAAMATSSTGKRSDAYAEHRSQTIDIINAGAVETRSMRDAGNKSPTFSDIETDSNNEILTDEEQGVDDTADTEFRRQGQTDISDALTDGQRTAGEADKQFLDAQRLDLSLQSLWTRAHSGRSVEFCINNGLLYRRTPSNAETDRDCVRTPNFIDFG